ncbi:MAG: hypothetical protein R3F14_29000 [Polyangiaceae bacterium]
MTPIFMAGCNPETTETEPDPSGLLDPPAPGKGVQYKMTVAIESGTESEKCMFVKAPDTDIMVQRDEVRFTPGSHHFLLYETAYTDIPTEKTNGTKVDTSGVFDCSDGATNGWQVTKLVGGSQNADGGSILSFPENVAMRVRGGAVLLMNAHYINTSSDVLEPEVRINLYTIPESQVEHEGDIVFYYNPFIAVPAQSEGRARMRCTIGADITMTNFQSHMHRRGVGYAASIVGEDKPFYENDLWEGVPVKDFGAGKKITKGSVLDYHCDYKNPEQHDVFQGPRTTDEMCMAIGSYYPADPMTSLCATTLDDGTVISNFGAEWVGNGDKTCKETMGCVQSAFNAEDVFEEITLCMLDSSPDKSKEVSDAIRCLFTHENPLSACQTEFATCQAN